MLANHLDLTKAVHYHTGQFPPAVLDYAALFPALNDAASSLARYDEKMKQLVNGGLLLAPLRRQDAVSSSRMENTISTVDDVYRLEAEAEAGTPDPYGEARDDDVETFLYSRAMRMGQEALQSGMPLGEHLIRALHQELLSQGRGARKRPGSYKTEQNYIGDGRSGRIHYIPVAPEHLKPAMERLVAWLDDPAILPLIRIAVTHVEFEALHPFEDGNGRIGRMLITLMLWRFGVLSAPNFFVSGYFEANKADYIERMRAVSAEGDWTGWVAFFLTALHHQAQENMRIADAIAGLYAGMRDRFRVVLNSQFYDKALDFVFGMPVFRNDTFVERAGIPASSARILSRRLAEAGLLVMLDPPAGRRAALYSFEPLLALLRD